MFHKITSKINQALMVVSGIFLVAMILLTCGNIFLRFVWVPIRGTFELMGFFGAIATSFALGYTKMRKGHISVDVLFRRFPPRIIRFLDGVNHLVCALFFAIVAWQLGEKGHVLFQTGEVTETLRIIYYPFTYGTAVGCGFLSLILMGRLFGMLMPEKGDKT
jgi:TRAP-type C4-dicarboxylate transport system permease small subunit